ncbi:hypothetical protein [Treponema denticola]|uniref:hypothetical protein n=1 Tax=Treponema denticola TaxID=158 RepID=UPI0021036DB5|nr:hypothetical protein [Treponema denticola]
MIYLDWAATALPQEDIITEALKKSFKYFANPSSKHFLGKDARKIYRIHSFGNFRTFEYGT